MSMKEDTKLISYYQEYLEKELGYSFNTVKNYIMDLKQYSSFLNSRKKIIKNVDKEIARDYLKYLDQKKLTNKSIARKLSSIRNFYNYLLDNGYIANNVFSNMSNPKIEKKLPEFLNYEEIYSLLESVDISTTLGLRNRLLLELIYATGMRLNEVANLKLKAINYQDKTIRVMGKGNKERIVYYGEYAEKYLNSYIKSARKELLKNKNNEYLFINRFGNRLHDEGIENVLKKQVKVICLKHKISIHTLRHTFATHLLNNGADIKTVQELLGHASLATTEVYTHLTNDRIREVYLKTHPRNINNNIPSE